MLHIITCSIYPNGGSIFKRRVASRYLDVFSWTSWTKNRLRSCQAVLPLATIASLDPITLCAEEVHKQNGYSVQISGHGSHQKTDLVVSPS